ncbi:MAG: hypothetical protein DMG78_07340, partial [Acidobacteria bacterium]
MNFRQRFRKFQPTIETATLGNVLPLPLGNNTLTISSIRHGVFVWVLLACYALAQAVQPERFERDFNVLFRGGE